jgi:hypothetical protein
VAEFVEWRRQASIEVQALSAEVQKWQSELKRETISWRNEMLREKNSWKAETLKEYDRLIKEEVKLWREGLIEDAREWKRVVAEEIQQIKGGIIHGDQEPAGKGTGTEDFLGSATGESDQVKADDTSGRKGRGRSTGTK